MTQEEAIEFENDALFKLSIRMRYWDEKAKETCVAIIDLGVLKLKATQLIQEYSNSSFIS
jgi:2-amino-1-hydroxyethylphosphonate dioxygenase (glycine-forming)